MGDYICTLCPRNCGAVRNEKEGAGFCRAGTLPRVARVAPHYWEEPCISGSKGSGAIFFSRCVMSCVFCQNHQISSGGSGRDISVEGLTECMKYLEGLGVHNINLVSPTPYVESIIEALCKYRPSVPIVYNTSGYEKAETLRRLEGIVDIYLPDMKYVSSQLSGKYSGASDYFEFALPAIREMLRQTGAPIFKDEILQKGTLVRHLILPGHTKESISVLRILSDEFGEQILISLMGQYVPLGKAKSFTEINRRITKREYDKVKTFIEKTSLNGYYQELSSAKEEYVPDFDLSKLPFDFSE